jgi:NTE family protein
MPRNVFAVFSGGGIKGAAFLGAIEEAEKYVRFVGWGGASAGSIIAALLACGYTPNELRTLLHAAPYSKFFQISIKRLLFFNRYRGMIDPVPLLEWLRQYIGQKFPSHSRVTFKDLKDDQYLKIVAANITTQQIVIYSKRTTPNAEIAQAVLASCSFPLLFPAVLDGNDELVDGGVLSNFPMWLFHDEEDDDLQKEFTPVLGFTLVSKPKMQEKTSILAHAFSIFDSILVAQDRVQEKYMDPTRFANVIRIHIDETPTFRTTQSPDQQNSLILAGKDAASKYFTTATTNYGERVNAPESTIQTTRTQALDGNHQGAVSAIARQHILHGGVARDDGLLTDRVLVKYYIDLMEAVTDHDKLEILAQVMAERIKTLGQFDRIVGIKKGNIILSYAVARELRKPLSVFKTDMSYKMGQPFDGRISAGESIIVVDDIASDASILVNAVRYLNFYHTRVQSVVTLIERTEGDARGRIMKERGVPLYSVCRVDDEAIQKLIYENISLPEGQGVSMMQ